MGRRVSAAFANYKVPARDDRGVQEATSTSTASRVFFQSLFPDAKLPSSQGPAPDQSQTPRNAPRAPTPEKK